MRNDEGKPPMNPSILGIASLILVAASAFAVVPRTPEWVDARVRAWQPTARERLWEGIGWADGLGHGLKLAKARRRPVFLFTLDGKMSSGRC